MAKEKKPVEETKVEETKVDTTEAFISRRLRGINELSDRALANALAEKVLSNRKGK